MSFRNDIEKMVWASVYAREVNNTTPLNASLRAGHAVLALRNEAAHVLRTIPAGEVRNLLAEATEDL